MYVCVVHVSLLCVELGNWVLMILSPIGSPSVISYTFDLDVKSVYS